MNKEELIEKLLDYKSALKNTYCDLDSVISNAMSDICDYNVDNGWWYDLDSWTYYYETVDWVIWFIKETAEQYWILTLKNRLSEVDSDCERYHIDDVDWTIYARDYWDVEEWIDNVLSELWYEEDEPTD